MPELTLAAEFPESTEQEWTALVDGVLRKARRIPEDAPAGAGVQKLVRPTYDGIGVHPLYTSAPEGSRPPGAGGWDVRQRHALPDPNAAVLADLENGVTSVWLEGAALDDLPRALDGVLLDLAPVVVEAPAAEAFLELGARHGDALLGVLGLDPIGLRARTGDGPDVESVVPLARRAAADHPRVRAVVADAVPVHAAGGSDAQELGFAVAAGVAYLRALTAAGLDLATAAGTIEFRIAATADQFGTIAKLRAARRLWSRVTDASGAAQVMSLHAVTSPTMLTRRDPYVNLLRGTLAGFAAGVGGADAVTVAPFDEAIGAPGAFSRRIARNTQILLLEEAHLARIADPAGGSWYVESLTDALARAAWAVLQEIEGAGGAVAALDSGLVAERAAEVRARRERDVATRKAPITGVSEFPDLDEKPVEREPVPDPPGGGLPVHRPSAPFEAHRAASDARLAETGSRPRAFLATLGPLAAYTARAGFTRNLLQAGGIEPVEAGPTETADEVVAAFRESGAGVAVLCSTDALYAERAADTAAALRAAGATRIMLAGRVDVDGVDTQLYAGCDALAVIEEVLS
ncbi:MAG: methylmalonyl-CoA mutase family protein [Pseudonocardiales bacterium]|nr:methylmalonyl-CoA mutase family protein [Pseudonocardiales bacterium]